MFINDDSTPSTTTNNRSNTMIKFNNPHVEFFGEPNNTGYNTNVNLTLSDNGKSVSAIAQINDNLTGYYLYGDESEIAASLGVSEQALSNAINDPQFDRFCEDAVEDAFWLYHQTSPARSHLFDEGQSQSVVLYDAQVSPANWSPKVIREGDDICLLATNCQSGEVKIVDLTEDDLLVIADELDGMPWSDAVRAEYLMGWVGA